MFGPFKATAARLGGYVWKRSWKMSPNRKYRLRKRMRLVDHNIETVITGLKNSGINSFSNLDKLLLEFPKEREMSPKDKYTTFNRTSRGYRKGVQLVPHWTKLSFRKNPKGF